MRGAPKRLLVGALFAVLAASCGGSDDGTSQNGTLADPGDLRGRTVGVASLADVSTLELRYVLERAYGIDAALTGGEVTFVESPAEDLPALLRDGAVDAAVLVQGHAFASLEDEELVLLSRVTAEMRELTDAPVVESLIVTYPDVVTQRGTALQEVNVLLAASAAYFRANRDQVIEAVAAAHTLDPDLLHWWAERHDLLLGDLSAGAQEGILALWQAAMTVGAVETYPDLADVLFVAREMSAAQQPDGDRTTVSMAVLDDPGRRAALYAIEQGIVGSETVDIDLTYLPRTALANAAAAKEYDVIEVAALAVPQAETTDVEFVILSPGVRKTGGTLLFVRREPQALLP